MFTVPCKKPGRQWSLRKSWGDKLLHRVHTSYCLLMSSTCWPWGRKRTFAWCCPPYFGSGYYSVCGTQTHPNTQQRGQGPLLGGRCYRKAFSCLNVCLDLLDCYSVLHIYSEELFYPVHSSNRRKCLQVIDTTQLLLRTAVLSQRRTLNIAEDGTLQIVGSLGLVLLHPLDLHFFHPQLFHYGRLFALFIKQRFPVIIGQNCKKCTKGGMICNRCAFPIICI